MVLTICSPSLAADPADTTSAILTARLAHEGSVLVTISPGTPLQLYGQVYDALEPARAYVSLSSEFITVAVLSGRVSLGSQSASPGTILVTPIEGARTEQFLFDAAVLSRTMSPAQAAEVGPLLTSIEEHQRWQRFFGLIEPVGVNAQSPTPGAGEAIRQTYLSDPAVIDLRRRAGGDPKLRGRLTVEAFARALAAGDAATAAALLDPKPFSDVTIDAVSWRAARLAFAQTLVADPALVQAARSATFTESGAGGFVMGGARPFRITVIERDRASFVAAMEPAS